MLATESMGSLSPAGNYDSQCENMDDSCDMTNWSVDSLKGDALNGMSSSNRRKQTKPSRMSSNKQNATTTAGDAAGTNEEKNVKMETEEELEVEVDNDSNHNNCDMETVRFSCQTCSLFFTSHEELLRHNRMEHEQQSMSSLFDKRDSGGNYKAVNDKTKPDSPIFSPSKYTNRPVPAESNKMISHHPQSNTTSVGMNSSVSGSNRDEDYCELCQKHFCNKYYLRKHKNDVHGISTDPPQNSRNSNSTTSMKKDYHSSSAAHQANMAANFSLFGQQGNPLHSGMFMSPNMFNPLSAAMLFNPFAAAAAASGSPMPAPLMNPHFLSIGQPGGIVNPAVSSSMFQPTSPSTMSSNQPTESSSTRNLRDSETFCDICRKELCNKYFLRTHKANKHGIKDDSATSPLSTSVATSMPSFTSSPNNLPTMKQPSIPWQPHLSHTFATTTTTNNNNNLPKIEKEVFNEDLSASEPENLSMPKKELTFNDASKSLDLSVSIMNTPKLSQDVLCNICNKSFTNHYALNLHFMSAHQNSAPETAASFLSSDARSVSSSNPLTCKNNRNSPPLDAFKNSMIAAKLADRVMCDICQKDLCNKYFLKTHKMKVHGVATSCDEMKPGLSPSSAHLHHTSGEDLSTPHDYSTPARPTTTTNQLHPEPAATAVITDVAYCELCKKDIGPKCLFNSHMLSTHGVNMDMFSGALGGAMPNGHKRASSIASNDSMVYDTQAQVHSFNSGSNQGSPGAKSGQGSSRWSHESPNQMRVMCDICDKWICNKYFLRTHKLKKHGISDSGTTPISSSNFGGPETSHNQLRLGPSSVDSSNSEIAPPKKQATVESLDATINAVLHKKEDISPRSDDIHKLSATSNSYKSMYPTSLDTTTNSQSKLNTSHFMNAFFSGHDFTARPSYPPPMGLNRFMMPPYFDATSFMGGDSAQAAMMMAAAAAAQYAGMSGVNMPPLGLGAALGMPELGRAETKPVTASHDMNKERMGKYQGGGDPSAMPVCSLCGLLCPDSEKLQKHIEQIHGGVQITQSRRSIETPLNLSVQTALGPLEVFNSMEVEDESSSRQLSHKIDHNSRPALIKAGRVLKKARRIQRALNRPMPNRKQAMQRCVKKQQRSSSANVSNENNNSAEGRSPRCPFCCITVNDLMSHFVTHHGIPKHQLPFAAGLSDHTVKLSDSKINHHNVDRDARAFMSSFMQLNALSNS